MSRAAPRLPSRREVLVGGALVALGGCLPDTEPAAPARSPEERLRARVADEVDDLAARYAAVMARFPQGRPELSMLAAEHEAHVRALRGRGPASRPRSPSPSPSPSPSATGPAAPAVPETLAEARASLAVVERAASRRRGRQATGTGPELARLLASIAACEATHAALLERPA
jgi:hypothetical protein